MSTNAKELRGQLRQVVKEMAQELITKELVDTIEKKLRTEMNARLNLIDERQKQIQGYMVRQSAPHVKKD